MNKVEYAELEIDVIVQYRLFLSHTKYIRLGEREQKKLYTEVHRIQYG